MHESVLPASEIRVGDVVVTTPDIHTEREWTVTSMSGPIDRLGMFLLHVTPERHKPIHTYPDSTWRVRRCTCPTDSEIDAAIEAATANLTTSRGNHD